MSSHLLRTSVASISLLLLCTQLVDGFSATNCKHDHLVAEIKQLLNCSRKSFDKLLDESLNVVKDKIQKSSNNNLDYGNSEILNIEDARLCPLMQNYYNEEILCASTLAKTCFEQKIAGLVSEFSSIFEGFCGNGHINETNLKKYLLKLYTTIGKYPDNIKYVVSTITFDKQCNLAERSQDLFKGTFKCVEKKYTNYQNSHKNDIQNYESRSPIPKCNAVVEMLDSCFYSNNCFSKKEMNLTRNMVFTIYHMGMEELAKFMHNLNSFGDSQEGLTGLDTAVEDFETENCKSDINSSLASLLFSAPTKASPGHTESSPSSLVPRSLIVVNDSSNSSQTFYVCLVTKLCIFCIMLVHVVISYIG